MSDYSQLEEQRQLPIWILNSEAIKSLRCTSSPLFQRRLWHAGHDFLYFHGNAPAHPSFLDHWGCSWLLGESMLLSFNIFAVPLTVACRFGPKCWINFDCWAKSWCQPSESLRSSIRWSQDLYFQNFLFQIRIRAFFSPANSWWMTLDAFRFTRDCWVYIDCYIMISSFD